MFLTTIELNRLASHVGWRSNNLLRNFQGREVRAYGYNKRFNADGIIRHINSFYHVR